VTVVERPILPPWTIRVQGNAPWLALVAVYALWGSTCAAIRVAIRVVSPFTMAGFRYSPPLDPVPDSTTARTAAERTKLGARRCDRRHRFEARPGVAATSKGFRRVRMAERG
jgi:hypothetical protein